jgi:phosphoribosylanthranilate isomerase
VEAVAPNAVDINSGVEITPGRKDKEKMASLMRIVEEAGLDRGGNIFNKR